MKNIQKTRPGFKENPSCASPCQRQGEDRGGVFRNLILSVFSSAGFTLIEMIMMIVVMGILLPAIFMPIIQSSKGMTTPMDGAGLGSVARTVMDEELARIDTVLWPPAAPLAPLAIPLNGNTFTSAITERICDKTVLTTCANTDVATANHYLIVQVVTTGSKGGSTTLETIKTKDY